MNYNQIIYQLKISTILSFNVVLVKSDIKNESFKLVIYDFTNSNEFRVIYLK